MMDVKKKMKDLSKLTLDEAKALADVGSHIPGEECYWTGECSLFGDLPAARVKVSVLVRDTYGREVVERRLEIPGPSAVTALRADMTEEEQMADEIATQEWWCLWTHIMDRPDYDHDGEPGSPPMFSGPRAA